MNDNEQHTSKKKIILAFGLSLVVIASVATIILFFVIKPEVNKNQANRQEIPAACTLFTENDAQEIIGDKAKKQPVNDNQNKKSLNGENLKAKPKAKTNITTCSYSRNGQVLSAAPQPTSQTPSGPPAPEVKTEADINNNAPATPVVAPPASGEGEDITQHSSVVIVVRSSSKEQAAQEYNTTKASAKGIKNLGEKAFWKVETSRSGVKGGLLSVLKDKVLINVMVNDSEEEVAKKIAARIESKL